jgi:hypothetical protein
MTKTDMWLVVIDDDEDAGGVVADHLPEFPVFSFTDPEAAAHFCAGNFSAYPHAARRSENHAILAFVDLWMGVGRPTGLDALNLLREVDRVPVWAVLRSLEVANDRELLAIAAAEVWGRGRARPGIHYVSKDTSRSTWTELRLICDALANTDVPEGTTPEQHFSDHLPWIKPLTFVKPNQSEVTLLEWLVELPWRLEYLRLIATGYEIQDARVRAGAPTTARDVAKTFKPVLGAHKAHSPDGRWLDHQGRLLLGSDDAIEGGNLTFITKFAERHRFLLASKSLPGIIAEHLARS